MNKTVSPFFKMLWVQLARVFRRKAGQGASWRWWMVPIVTVVCGFVLLQVFSLRIPRSEVREPPRADSLLALQRILGLLDPRFVQQEAPSEQLQQSLLTVDDDGSDSDLLEVCPERYLGPTHDPPYHTHAFTSDCDNQVWPPPPTHTHALLAG
ncbi:uncharacterized protein LOC123506180 isoform X2 [Portunus trituberculatus]|uniref:uncharacterized protein LOC123506180 isoform X2 n=1 Tax=Portunus trituberculatus TaxID=210409 RepID=UPI001E1CFFB4|nr:uncharacterized protein LOC123506180 isoform X2 [Portunus trituberculatus]